MKEVDIIYSHPPPSNGWWQEMITMMTMTIAMIVSRCEWRDKNGVK